MPDLAPKPTRAAGGTLIAAQRVSVGSSVAVFSGFSSSTNLIAAEVQGNDLWVTFDGTAPSASNGHRLYATQVYHWNVDTAGAAKFIEVTGAGYVQASEFAAVMGGSTHLTDTSIIKNNPVVNVITGSGSGSGAIVSVFGRTGVVSQVSGDYSFSQIGSKPTTISGYGITDGITSTLAANKILVGNASNQAIQVLSQPINVLTYGAVGDGSNDDTSAINAALGALPANNGAIYFPYKKYRITGSGLNGLSGKTHLTIFGDGAEIFNTGHNNSMVIDGTCSDISMRGIFFTGDASVRANGVHVRTQASRMKISDCGFHGCSDFGLFIGYDNSTGICYDTVVSGCVFANTLGDGVHVMNGCNVVIANNAFNHTGDDSIGIVADVTATPPNRVLITGNNIYDAKNRGIAICEGIDVQVIGNNIYTCVQSGIECNRASSVSAYNTRVLISGNKLYNTTTTGGALGSLNLRFCYQTSVKGNQVIDPANGGGISFLDCNDFDVSENMVRGAPSRGINSDDTTTANVATTWDRINICRNFIEYVVANGGIYVVPNSSTTITNLLVNGNDISYLADAGSAIYYNRINGGRVCNNTNPHGYAYAAGGTVSGVTATNNN